jgi:pimeloyl-ACP methyl ester carboxylesterase
MCCSVRFVNLHTIALYSCMTSFSLTPGTLEHAKTNIDGWLFHTTSIGPADAARTVLFFHGWQQSGAAAFFPFLRQFRYDNTIRVIAIDLPGFGESRMPEPVPTDFAAYISLVAAWASQYTRSEQVDLIGYSFGGVIASALIAQNPTYYRRLTLIASPVCEPAVPATPHVFATPDLQQLYHSYQDSITGAPSVDHLQLPVLLMWGTRDTVVTLRQGRHINAILANSRLIVLDTLDHKLYHAPEQLYLPIKQYTIA